ncbi:centrosomal protein of 19 kDa isoform X1 [Mustela erminea]|uniref:centrosomal protein of 19 kDa isoform X1 n=2 Tax=Mustela erminea TaxID=36723 RepID=UPI0013866294|nr:centrosomal protein of 19 kDa isoform X1 [Mustela erminea]
MRACGPAVTPVPAALVPLKLPALREAATSPPSLLPCHPAPRRRVRGRGKERRTRRDVRLGCCCGNNSLGPHPDPSSGAVLRAVSGSSLSPPLPVHVRMMCTAKKCGIRFQPPAIILIYENEMKGKRRQRIMPVRNFSKFSDCNRAAEQLKNNPRHKSYLEQVSLRQLEKLFIFLRGYLLGQSLAETMEQIQRETTIDPEEDLNKLDDKELAKRKSIMDELFEKNQKKKDDPDFVYDIEVEFPQDEQLQSCGWDTESADEF